VLSAGAAAYAAKVFFTADSFYLYGHYRGKSVAEIASDKPKFKGSAYCESCHAEIFAQWSKGVHHSIERGKVVQCEVCHGPAGGRDAGGMFEHVATGVDHPASGKLAVPADSLKLCPVCHEKIVGRPQAQPQIAIAEHAGSQQCTSCHNPHSPKMVRTAAPSVRSGEAAAGPAASCSGCHGANGVSANPAWPNLAGQHSGYLVDALKAYRSGARQNAMMSAITKGLSEADMRKIAGYYSGLKKAGKGSGRKPAHAVDTSACAACHGAGGISGNPAWPNLAGQQSQYLANALKAYKAGTRKNELMSGIAKGLDEADMNALAGYYAGLQ
jgi:cytochrome c553